MNWKNSNFLILEYNFFILKYKKIDKLYSIKQLEYNLSNIAQSSANVIKVLIILCTFLSMYG